LEFEIRAEAGGGNEDVQRVSVAVGSELLVDVDGSLESPLISESGTTAARLALVNRTACELRGLELRADLVGASPVRSSIEIDGVAASQVGWEEGRLTVPDLVTGAHATSEVTFLVQPGLAASEVSLAGEVWLNGVRVSEPARLELPDEAPASCGCQTGHGAPVGLLLVGLLMARRRRRAA
jgi:MYXO-CTERM domain-containing protein